MSSLHKSALEASSPGEKMCDPDTEGEEGENKKKGGGSNSLGAECWEAEKYMGKSGIVSTGNYFNFYPSLSFLYTPLGWAAQSLGALYGVVGRPPLSGALSSYHAAPSPS